ncbi:LysR substrate-binding domain-containing protein [Shimia sp.]|uniref:LysR substrate-binding domain-containing protein n=1 Tax=Shimia sp. TaxID=1954381 RepID=UPI003BAA85DA
MNVGVMLRNHDLNLLPIFEALMREQHLSRAAERLNMSQPAVSNALKRLRLEFEDDLFVRTARGLKPTQRALELHERIQPALVSILDGFEDRGFEADTFSRTITIAMNHAVEYLWGGALLQAIRAQAPMAKLKVHPDYSDDVPTQLKAGHLNYAVDYNPLPEDQFCSIALAHEKLTLICSADHPKANSGFDIADFETLPQASLLRRSEWIRSKNSRRHTPLEYLMGEELPNRNVVVQVASFLSIPSIVASTDLIAVVPQQLADPLLQTGALCAHDLPFECPDVVLHLFWHKSRNSDPSHIWLLDLLKDRARVAFGAMPERQ